MDWKTTDSPIDAVLVSCDLHERQIAESLIEKAKPSPRLPQSRVFTKFTLQEVQRIEVGEITVFREHRIGKRLTAVIGIDIWYPCVPLGSLRGWLA